MAGSVFDSPLYSRLFPTGDIGRLFTDSADIRAMLLVEGTLAKVQGALGVIPADSAALIHRSSLEIVIDPGAIAAPAGENSVCVPGLVAAFRKEMNAPEHAQYVHFGATSQDIIDTGLVLRLRRVLAGYETHLDAILADLSLLARTHADLPMAARTWGQHATPTSFGAVVAAWGRPLLRLRDELPALRNLVLWVSLSGAAGTASALGPKAREIRAALAKELSLIDPGHSWHNDRTPILALGAWITRIMAVVGTMADDLMIMNQVEIGEINLGTAGASSTMPQKQNPVGPGTILALARHATALNTTLQNAGIHRQERDGPAWMTEWLALPQLCLGAATALEHTARLAKSITPRPTQMAAPFTDGSGLIFAEALSFALAAHMSRPDAQQAVKSLCHNAVSTGASLAETTARTYPDIDFNAVFPPIFDPAAQLGDAPADARAFADKCAKSP